MQQSVKNEVEVMKMVQSDFVVRLVQAYKDDYKLYMLLDVALGGELFEVYYAHDLFKSEPHARFYSACMSLALEYMHKQRLAYRDLKLENCLLDTHGYLKITD